ncbi:hypothetical protein ACC689_36580, partial [Rhizobium ruizarguesonis]
VDRNAANAAEAVGRIEAVCGKAESRVLDVTDDAALEAGTAAVAERPGRIDILHNHAVNWLRRNRSYLTAERYVNG